MLVHFALVAPDTLLNASTLTQASGLPGHQDDTAQRWPVILYAFSRRVSLAGDVDDYGNQVAFTGEGGGAKRQQFVRNNTATNGNTTTTPSTVTKRRGRLLRGCTCVCVLCCVCLVFQSLSYNRAGEFQIAGPTPATIAQLISGYGTQLKLVMLVGV